MNAERIQQAIISGTGLLAQALQIQKKHLSGAFLFARGVSDSTCIDIEQFHRERDQLYSALSQCHDDARVFVYFSSAGTIYGQCASVRDEFTPLQPTTVYGEFKVAFESIVRSAGVPHLIVRLPNLVGPSQNHRNLLPALIRQAAGGRVTLHRDATRDILDVRDVGRIISELLARGVRDETLLLASGISLPVIDLFSLIQQYTGLHAKIAVQPGGTPQAFDISKLCRLLGQNSIFSGDYPNRVIREYAPAIARSLG